MLIKENGGNPTVTAASPGDTWPSAQRMQTAKDPEELDSHRSSEAAKPRRQPGQRNQARTNLTRGRCTPSRREKVYPGATQPPSQLCRSGRVKHPESCTRGLHVIKTANHTRGLRSRQAGSADPEELNTPSHALGGCTPSRREKKHTRGLRSRQAGSADPDELNTPSHALGGCTPSRREKT